MFLPFAYPLANLRARRTRTLLTLGVVALVVLATTLFAGLVSSLKRSLSGTGQPGNLVVLRKGAPNDGASALSLDAIQAVRFFEGVARDAEEPIVSPELVAQPFFLTLEGRRENVLVRGVEPMALGVHDEVKIVEGRMLRPSSGEAIVGTQLTGRYRGAAVGSELRFGRGRWKVVGRFEAGGSAFESEAWVDVHELANDTKRPLPYSGLRLRVADGADVDALVRRIESDPRWPLAAHRESEYYARQADAANVFYVIVVGLMALAGIGATFGATNTLLAAVQARRAEIGTLRALGFGRLAILTSFLCEALLLSLGGFVVGALAAVSLGRLISWSLGGIAFSAETFTTQVVQLRVGVEDLGMGLVLALAIGLLGGLLPAIRAAGLRPMEALRNG